MRPFIALALASLLAACAHGEAARAGPAAGAPGRSAAAKPDRNAKSYTDITKGTTRHEGIFTVHVASDKLLYEIPRDRLGKPFLWVTQIAKAQEGTGFGGTPVGNLVVRWELRDGRVLLREETFGIVAPDSIAAAHGVRAATFPRVIHAFEVAAFAPDSAPVVDVTELFTRDVPEISPRRRLGGALGEIRRLDNGRSFLERVAVFPENIEVEATLTFETARDQTISALVHQSMVKLPDRPMMPRLADPRVGFFTVTHRDYSREHFVQNNTSYEVTYIKRWRLECREGESTPCEPVKPIVYHLGREIPGRYRPAIKAGIESWRPAFEAAGFRNAIVARDAPAPEADPDWSAEDARVSSIRWYPTAATNAMGPSVHDPRTGEILESDIIMHGGLLDRYRALYIAQVGADMGVQGGQLPDSVEYEILRSVIAHEVGHALGLRHNMSASSAYPVDSLRSGSFTRKHSISPSIMDYTRFNYVAQPGDGALRVRILGPYDYFAIKWGYTPIPDAGSPEAELPRLNEWTEATAYNPRIAFSSDDDNARSLTEDLGDDPVAATEYGLRNIHRSFAALREAMAVPGDDFENLAYMYDQLLDQRDRMFHHVLALIGGSYWRSRTYGQEGTVYRPVPEAEQRRALEFLGRTALRKPDGLDDPATTRLFNPFGGAKEIMNRQAHVVGDLLAPERLADMAALEATAESDASVYALAEYLADLRGTIFEELHASRVGVDEYRRNVQRAYIERAARVVADTAAPGEARAALRAELVDVRRLAERARPRAAGRVTVAHLDFLAVEIERVLEPR